MQFTGKSERRHASSPLPDLPISRELYKIWEVTAERRGYDSSRSLTSPSIGQRRTCRLLGTKQT